MLEDFLALTAVLTGVENLDPTMGRLNLDRLNRTLNNSSQPQFDPFGNSQPDYQSTTKKIDGDRHVIVSSSKLAKIFEAYFDGNFQQATLHVANVFFVSKTNPKPKPPEDSAVPQLPDLSQPVRGDYSFAAPLRYRRSMQMPMHQQWPNLPDQNTVTLETWFG